MILLPNPLLPWVVLLAFGIAPAAHGEGVVLSSTAPGVAMGQMVADGDVLHLPDDSVTVVLLATGQVVKLMGPYEGKVAATGAGGDQPGKTVLGVSPVVPAIDATAAVVVDGTQSGTWCVTAGAPLQLAAPPSQPSTVDLEDQNSGARATVAWPPAIGNQPWPAQLAPRDGTAILARWAPTSSPRVLQFRVFSGEDQSPSSRLITWWQAGCRQQVGPRLQALGAEVVPFSLFLSTERGRAPRYAPGEPVTLVVQANRSALLYCFVIQGGRVRSVFPGKPGHTPLPDQTALWLSADHLPVDVTAPPRLSELRCYAITPDEASAFAGKWGATPSADLSPETLDRVFESLPAAQVAQARVIVRTD